MNSVINLRTLRVELKIQEPNPGIIGNVEQLNRRSVFSESSLEITPNML